MVSFSVPVAGGGSRFRFSVQELGCCLQAPGMAGCLKRCVRI